MRSAAGYVAAILRGLEQPLLDEGSAEAGQSEDAFVSPREYFSGDENNYLDQVYAAGSAVGTPMAPHPPLSPRGGPSPAKKRPQIRRLGAMGQSEREDGGGSKVCDVMLAAAAVHVADAIAYRDFSDYGDYGGHSRQEPSDFARTESASSRSSSNQFEDVHGVSGTLRAFCCKNFWLPLVGAGAGRRKCAMRRVRAHKLYYANAGIKVVRTTSMLCLQLLVLTEAPPWCVSLSKDAGGGTCNVATLPEYEMSGFPILSPATTHMIEGVCLFVQALDLTVRRFVHGEALWSQAFEAWAAGMMFLNCLLWGVSCVLLSVRATPPTSTQTTTWILSAWYLRVVARMPIYILRARRLRRDLAGVVLAAGEIGEVLVSLGAVLLGFSWVAFTLFSPYYVGGGGGVNVDLSSFPRALQSLFVLLTAANFPDVMLPAYHASRLNVLFFLAFIILAVWIGQSLVLATVFNAYKRQNIRQFKQQFQSARMRALDRSFRALLAASPQQPGDGEQVPVHVFEQFCGHEYMQHALFREHPLLLRQLADANDDGGISADEFKRMDQLLQLQEMPPKLDVGSLEPHLMTRTRRFAWRLVTHWSFEWVVAAGVVISAVVAVTDAAAVAAGEEEAAAVGGCTAARCLVNTMIAAAFSCELALRITAVGSVRRWWRHSCTLADSIDAVVTVLVCLVAGAFVVECSLVEAGGAGSARGGAAQTVRVVNALAVLRLLRLARLGRTEPRVLALVHTAQAIAPFFLRFLRLLFFVALLFAVDGSAFDKSNGIYSYMPLNFNDVPAALVVLLALLVVNNWFVLCDQFVAATGTEWARLYFVLWWVVGVCILLNVLVAFVLEVFVAEFQRHHDLLMHERVMEAEAVERQGQCADRSNLHESVSTRLGSLSQHGRGAALGEEGEGHAIFLQSTRQVDVHLTE